MDVHSDILLDLLTDNSDSTRQQLLTALENRCIDRKAVTVTVLTAAPVSLELPSYQTVISSNEIDAMFKVKCRLDAADVTEFLLVTSAMSKKFWETLCVHLYSHVHVWAVLGVDVLKQSYGIVLADTSQVESNLKNYLRSITDTGVVEIIRSAIIPEDLFNAGFHTREGGVSQYPSMASMNMVFSVKKVDPIAVVMENRRRLAEAAEFDVNRLEYAQTIHGENIWVVGKEKPHKFDGLVTNTPGVTLAAPGADCCVILLADTNTGACGVVHAGWAGTVKGTVVNGLTTMMEEFGTDPCDVRVAIGPSVEATCFELPAKDAQIITDIDPTLTWPSTWRDGWVHTDLPTANSRHLERMGVLRDNIDLSTAKCTACNKEKYFSHRRDDIPFGNQCGFISCREK